MKRSTLLAGLALAIVALLVIATGTATADPPFIEFDSTLFLCVLDYDPAHTTMWEAGHTNHGRDGIQWLFGGSPEMGYGPVMATVNWNVNFNTGQGVAWGTKVHDIYDADGNWLGAFNGQYNGVMHPADPPAYYAIGTPVYLLEGKGVSTGTGAFAGQLMKFNIVQEVYDGPNPCQDVFGLPAMAPVVQHVHSRVIMTGGG